MTDTVLTRLDTPIGTLVLRAAGGALVQIDLPEPPGTPSLDGDRDGAQSPWPLPEVLRQLDAYFAGRLTRFELPLDARGTAFQRAVWAELERIPFGATRTYAAIAAALGRPRAVRAVGAANGRNPLPIVVPCHRVIGTGGALTGYAGGLETKRWLLAHEAAVGHLATADPAARA